MSWKLRKAGWNKGMKRVILPNGRVTYRYPDSYESNSGCAGVAMGGVIVLGLLLIGLGVASKPLLFVLWVIPVTALTIAAVSVLCRNQ